MIVRLAAAPAEYVKAVFDTWRARLEEVLARCHVKGEDIEVGQSRDSTNNIVSSRLIVRDEDTGARYKIRVKSGVLGIELIP